MAAPHLPLVSVVIPVRNGARHVSASVGSVLTQTYSHLECIVVDDGSDDGTGAILATFGDRIRVVTQPPRGAAAARNSGVAAARGSLVAFLDADDLWLPSKLHEQVTLLSHVEDSATVLSGYRVVTEDLRPRRDLRMSDVDRRLREAILLRGPGLASSSTAVVDRSAFEAVGGYDERLRCGEDLDLLWRLRRRNLMVSVARPLVLHRRHRDQMTASFERLEQDATVLMERVLADGFPATPATVFGSLHAYLGWRHLSRGEPRRALGQLRRAIAADRRSVLVVPAHALRRRLSRRDRPLPDQASAPSSWSGDATPVGMAPR